LLGIATSPTFSYNKLLLKIPHILSNSNTNPDQHWINTGSCLDQVWIYQELIRFCSRSVPDFIRLCYDYALLI